MMENNNVKSEKQGVKKVYNDRSIPRTKIKVKMPDVKPPKSDE